MTISDLILDLMYAAASELRDTYLTYAAANELRDTYDETIPGEVWFDLNDFCSQFEGVRS